MTNLIKEIIMTSKTNQEIRKDVSRFSGLCLLYTLAMSAVVAVYSIVILLIFIYQHREGNLQAAKEAASQFLANDGACIFMLYRLAS